MHPRWLGILAPGRYLRMLEDLGAIMPSDGPPDVTKVLELFARYDTEVVAPG